MYEYDLQKMIDWIENNLLGNPSLIELSMHIGYSPYYCSVKFHQSTGMTIKSYIARRRLYHAAMELRDTNLRILDIALKYCFSSQEAFTRAFANAYGCTPYEYRKNPKPMQLYIKQDVISPKLGIDKGDSMIIGEERTVIQNVQKEIGEKYGRSLLNILNGQEMYNNFCQNNIMVNGAYVPFNEAMCVGEVSSNIFSKQFNECRCNTHNVTMEQYTDVVLKPLRTLFEDKYEGIVLWFGDDMFCQINLLTILGYLDEISYNGNIVLQLVREDIDEIENSYFELQSEGYSETYKQVVVHKQLPGNISLPVMYNGIRLYLEYSKQENEITSYIKKHTHLTKGVLVQKLLKTFSRYGLGDMQYMQLIERCDKI